MDKVYKLHRLAHLVTIFVTLLLTQFTSFSSAFAAQTLSGSLQIVVTDSLDLQEASYAYYLLQYGQPAIELQFEEGQNPSSFGLLSGEEVVVDGNFLGSEQLFAVQSVESLGLPSDDPRLQQRFSGSMDVRKVLIVLLNFENQDLSGTCADPSLYSTSLYTDNTSVKRYFESTSFGQISLDGDADQDQMTDIVGPYTLSSSATPCDQYGWAFEADQQAIFDGVNFALYRHVMYILPDVGGQSCRLPGGQPSAGQAEIGCGALCRSWIYKCFDKDVIAHELGHNLGMKHATSDRNNDGNIDDEYGDDSCLMGGAMTYTHLNAPHMDQMGWLDHIPGAVQQVHSNAEGVYRLKPLDSAPGNEDDPRIIKVISGRGFYYLAARERRGHFTAGMPNHFLNRISVHHYLGAGSVETHWITNLTPGNQQHRRVFQDRFLQLTLDHLGNRDGGADVAIFFGPYLHRPPGNAVDREHEFTTDFMTAHGDVRLYVGRLEGSTTVTDCLNAQLEVASIRKIATRGAGAGGVARFSGYVHPRHQGRPYYVQALDMTTCQPSNVVPIVFE